MSRAVVVSLRPHYVIVPKLNSQHMTVTWRDHTVADPEKGPGGGAPALLLDQNEAWRAKKQFFGDHRPYLRVWMTAATPSPPPPAPTLSEGAYPPLPQFRCLTNKFNFFAKLNADGMLL